jgi:hypothetical protein
MQTHIKILFFVLSLSANALYAQNFQLAGIGYSSFAKTRIKDSPTNQEVKFQEFSFFAKLPIKFKNQKTVLMNNLRYGLVQPTTYNSPLFVATENKKNLHSVALSMTLIQKLCEKWSLIAALTPTLASDFKEKLSGDDLLFQGTLLASAKLNDKWSLGGGLIYTTQLGDPRFLPAIQLRYLHNRHFINVLLPSFVNYLYKVDSKDKLHLGFRLATNGGNFNVNNQDYTKVIPNSINKILLSRVNMGTVVNVQLTKTILLEAFGGISAARKYKLENALKQFYDYASENGSFFNLGIILTPASKTVEDSKVGN